jgi:hypothetical protein
MEVLGGLRLADLPLEVDLLRAATLATDRALDLKQIDLRSSGDGKKKDAVKTTGVGRKIDAVRKIGASPTKKGSVKKSDGVWRCAVDLRKNAVVRRPATQSGSLVSGRLQRSTAWRKKLVLGIAGRIDLRCSLDPPSTPLPAADPPM